MVGRFYIFAVFGFGLATLALVGCSRNVDRPYAAAEDRLLKIGKAYLKSVYDGKTPSGSEDIKIHYLEEDVTEEFFRSPRDGEPFVIFWGVDYSSLPTRPSDPFTVAAYEKKGENGKRYVLRFPLNVELMTDEQLRKAVFPPGHSPP